MCLSVWNSTIHACIVYIYIYIYIYCVDISRLKESFYKSRREGAKRIALPSDVIAQTVRVMIMDYLLPLQWNHSAMLIGMSSS